MHLHGNGLAGVHCSCENGPTGAKHSLMGLGNLADGEQ